jgi:hypothetical protein
METDASDFVLGAVLSQEGDGRRLHLVAFYSRTFFAVEINYEFHNKELLTIVDSFQEWHHLFEGISHPVIVYIDHKNLEYFMTAHVLNRRQAHWNMFYLNLTLSLHIGPESNKGCLMIYLGGHILYQRKERQHMSNNGRLS